MAAEDIEGTEATEATRHCSACFNAHDPKKVSCFNMVAASQRRAHAHFHGTTPTCNSACPKESIEDFLNPDFKTAAVQPPAPLPPPKVACALCRRTQPHGASMVAVAGLVVVANIDDPGVGVGIGPSTTFACLDCAEAWAKSPEAARVRAVARAALHDFAEGQRGGKR